jgi:hypothetical protein
MYVGRPGAYTKVEYYKVPPALLTNIRLCWKGLSGTNTLAYYENLKQQPYYDGEGKLMYLVSATFRQRELAETNCQISFIECTKLGEGDT